MAASLDNTASQLSHKRKRVEFEQSTTPPLSASDSEGARLLSRAVHVLSTAASALSQVTVLYESDHHARDGLLQAVDTITRINEAGGKLIVCGVGKSGLVGRKVVATMKSLGIACSFMHAAEALHGDLGDIRKVNDLGMNHLAIVLIIFRTTPSSSSPTPARPRSSSPSCPTFRRTRPSLPSLHTSAHPTVHCCRVGQPPFCYQRPYTSSRKIPLASARPQPLPPSPSLSETCWRLRQRVRYINRGREV